MENELNLEGFLPIFSGFYGSIFDGYISMEMLFIDSSNVNTDMLEWVSDNLYDYFDSSSQMTSVGKDMTNIVEKWVKDIFPNLNFSIEFEEVRSPKYYNYTNDSINVIFHTDHKFIKEVQKYLFNNLENFAVYLKENFTSYDGFISGHPNTTDEWIGVDVIEEKLGFVLDFILQNEKEDAANQLEIEAYENDWFLEYIDQEKLFKDLNEAIREGKLPDLGRDFESFAELEEQFSDEADDDDLEDN